MSSITDGDDDSEWQTNVRRKQQSQKKLTGSSDRSSSNKNGNIKSNSNRKPNQFKGSWAKPKQHLQEPTLVVADVTNINNPYGETERDFGVHAELNIGLTAISTPTQLMELGEKEESLNNIGNADKAKSFSNGALAPRGKGASIQVEFVSFGYKYGISRTVTGSTFSNPLPPLDCRDLPEIPLSMARLSGLNHHVKRVLSRLAPPTTDTESTTSIDLSSALDDSSPLLQKANQLAMDVILCIQESIANGFGCPSCPLDMTIFVGSATGRHRSVVVCEFAAISLRKLLRNTIKGTIIITQLVSVSTRHLHVDQQKKPSKESS